MYMEREKMNAREKVLRIFERKEVPKGAMWTGHPSDEIIPILAQAWGIEPDREAIFNYLNDDVRWIGGVNCYQAPDGRPALDPFWNMENILAMFQAKITEAILF